MARQILIALKDRDRLSEFIPYIQELAQPGMKVILLIRYAPKRFFSRPRANWATLKPLEDLRFPEEPEERPFPEDKAKRTDSSEESQIVVERQVVRAEESLRKSGVEIAAHVYTGSLRAVVKTYTRHGNVHFIIKRARWYLPMISLCLRMFPILGLFKRSSLPPMLLLHPQHGV